MSYSQPFEHTPGSGIGGNGAEHVRLPHHDHGREGRDHPRLLAHDEIAGRWPNTHGRHVQTLDALDGDRRPLACKHVIMGGFPWMICAEHPAAGILCGRCADRHVDRHSDAVETRCDECGVVGGPVHLMTGVALVVGLRVGETTGRHRPLTGPLIVFSAGVCPACYAEGVGR